MAPPPPVWQPDGAMPKDDSGAREAGAVKLDRRQFADRAAIAALALTLTVGLTYLAWHYAQILLLLFAAILLAILMASLTDALARRTPLSRSWSAAVVWLALLALVVAVFAFGGPRITEQLSTLSERITDAVSSIRDYLEQRQWGEWVLKEIRRAGTQQGGSGMMARAAGFFSTALSWVGNIAVVLVLALYLSLSPSLYVDNLLRLVPRSRRKRCSTVLEQIAHSLRWWLVGRLSTMAILGVLTTIGLAAAGVSLALILGLLAAITAFVPYVGPIIWLIPASLVAWSEGPTKVLWVLIIYTVVQTLESYFITPIIQQRAVSLPPALLLAVQLFMGVLFGVLGLLVATPLGVAVIVLVQLLYVEDVLGEEVRLLGPAGEQ